MNNELTTEFGRLRVFWFTTALTSPSSVPSSALIMPLCFCVSSGCSTAGGTDSIFQKSLGKLVDPHMLKAHANADRKAAFHAAQQNTEAAINSQIKEITAYLSASVLADEVSGPLQNPGSSLWSRLLRSIHPKINPLFHPRRQNRHSMKHCPLPQKPLLDPPLPTLHLAKPAHDIHARLRFLHVWLT